MSGRGREVVIFHTQTEYFVSHKRGLLESNKCRNVTGPGARRDKKDVFVFVPREGLDGGASCAHHKLGLRGQLCRKLSWQDSGRGVQALDTTRNSGYKKNGVWSHQRAGTWPPESVLRHWPAACSVTLTAVLVTALLQCVLQILSNTRSEESSSNTGSEE